MIGRCDRCDSLRRIGATGHRFDPAVAPITNWRCSICGGPLRGKRKADSEANIIDAKLAKQKARATR